MVAGGSIGVGESSGCGVGSVFSGTTGSAEGVSTAFGSSGDGLGVSEGRRKRFKKPPNFGFSVGGVSRGATSLNVGSTMVAGGSLGVGESSGCGVGSVFSGTTGSVEGVSTASGSSGDGLGAGVTTGNGVGVGLVL
jgi:hypothetical protein